jgi:excisionase family DNA binding protein
MARLLHPIPEAGEQLGVGRSTLYELIAAGELRTVKIGRRTLISHEELERYVRALASDATRGTAELGAA